MGRGVKRVVEAEKERERGRERRLCMSSWRERGSKRERQEREEGANSPFYSGPGLPGCCQVTVGRSIPGCCQVTVGVESRQNTRSLGHCLND